MSEFQTVVLNRIGYLLNKLVSKETPCEIFVTMFSIIIALISAGVPPTMIYMLIESGSVQTILSHMSFENIKGIVSDQTRDPYMMATVIHAGLSKILPRIINDKQFKLAPLPPKVLLEKVPASSVGLFVLQEVLSSYEKNYDDNVAANVAAKAQNSFSRFKETIRNWTKFKNTVRSTLPFCREDPNQTENEKNLIEAMIKGMDKDLAENVSNIETKRVDRLHKLTRKRGKRDKETRNDGVVDQLKKDQDYFDRNNYAEGYSDSSYHTANSGIKPVSSQRRTIRRSIERTSRSTPTKGGKKRKTIRKYRRLSRKA